MIKSLYEFKQDLDKKGIFLSFSGPISQDLVVEIGATLKQKMLIEEASKTTMLKVFTMVIENAQNIIHYSAEKYARLGYEEGSQLSFGIITVVHENGHYFVLCGNMIENSRVEKLKSKLDRIKTMNKEELNQYYKEQRRQETDKDSRGGGLGFIEMARKATMPIEYNFKLIDEKLSFFSLRVFI